MSVAVHADGALRALEQLETKFLERVSFIVKDTARYAKKQAQVTRLFEDRTGFLRQSTEARFIPSGYRSFIRNDAPYARYIEEGTTAHYIYPSRSDKLRFFWDKLQRNVELDSVFHPGTKARPFFKAAGYLGNTFLHERLSSALSGTVARHNRAK